MLLVIVKANCTEQGQAASTAASGGGQFGTKRGVEVKKGCSGYCCGKQINLPYDIFIYQEKQMGVGEQAKTSFNYYFFEKECAWRLMLQ